MREPSPETYAQRIARELYERQDRESQKRQRVADEARQRLGDNPEALAMAHVAHSVNRLGGSHWEGTALPGQVGFEADGYQPQPIPAEDVAVQNTTRALFNQALMNERLAATERRR